MATWKKYVDLIWLSRLNHLGSGVGPKSKDQCPYTKGEETEKHVGKGHRQSRAQNVAVTSQGTPEATMHWQRRNSLSLWKEVGPADTLILDLSPEL